MIAPRPHLRLALGGLLAVALSACIGGGSDDPNEPLQVGPVSEWPGLTGGHVTPTTGEGPATGGGGTGDEPPATTGSVGGENGSMGGGSTPDDTTGGTNAGGVTTGGTTGGATGNTGGFDGGVGHEEDAGSAADAGVSTDAGAQTPDAGDGGSCDPPPAACETFEEPFECCETGATGEVPFELDAMTVEWGQAGQGALVLHARGRDLQGRALRIEVAVEGDDFVALRESRFYGPVPAEVAVCAGGEVPRVAATVKLSGLGFALGFSGSLTLSGEGWAVELPIETPNVCVTP